MCVTVLSCAFVAVRYKMIPKVSPGKTWEGFFGAIILSTVVVSLGALTVLTY